MGDSVLDRSSLTRYLAVGASINTIRAVKASLPAVRSGVASYFRPFHLLGRPPFPPTEDTAQLWRTTFNPGKTIAQYLAHLQKAADLMNMTPDWSAPSARATEKALKTPTT